MIDSMAVLPVFLAFAGSAALGPVLIPVLTRLKMDQTERELGVKSHLQKAGTPTMGGIIFLIPVTVVSLIFIWKYPKIGPVLFLMLAFGLIGFLDDYLKVVKKQSDGLLPKQKLALQFAATLVFVLYVRLSGYVDFSLRIPFAHGKMLDIGIFAYPLLFFAVLGTVNGVNFTDGLDGLASSVTAVVACFFAVAALLLGTGTAPVSSAVAGGAHGLSALQCLPREGLYGGHRFPRAGRLCGRDRLYDEYAPVHPDRGADLPDRGAVRHPAGELF